MGNMLKNKWFFVVFFVFVLMGLTAVVWWYSGDRYVPAFTNLNATDRQYVVSELQKQKIDYQMSADQQTILVKDSDYAQTGAAGSNATQMNQVGFEIFAKEDFSVSEFAQRINYIRALQGELERTLLRFQEIKEARVHISLPEHRLFAREDSAEAKAAVTIATKPDVHLLDEQVQGIQGLVASAVPGMSPSNVMVINELGAPLTMRVTNPAQAELLYKKDLEQYMAQKASAVLLKALGEAKNFSVVVDVAFSSSEKSVDQEDFSPNTVINRKRELLETQVDTPNAKEGEVLSGSLQKKLSKSQSLEQDFSVGRRVEKKIEKPFAVQRTSVSVVVSDASLIAGNKQALVDLVGNALGLRLATGQDSVAITFVGKQTDNGLLKLEPVLDHKAPTPAVSPISSSGQAAQSFYSIVGYVLVGLGALVIVWILFASGKNAKRALTPKEKVLRKMLGGSAGSQGGK